MVKSNRFYFNRYKRRRSKIIETTKDKDKDASNSLIPADFLIERVQYSIHLDDHLPIEHIYKFAEI